jgi:hypothetical protein
MRTGASRIYLLDTHVISETRKGQQADRGVRRFFQDVIRQRGDEDQARQLERWFFSIMDRYSDYLLDFDAEIALIQGLTVVTRNRKGFSSTGVKVINPFQTSATGGRFFDVVGTCKVTLYSGLFSVNPGLIQNISMDILGVHMMERAAGRY